ncbi:mechanosensitive ion channel [Pistricoccus aurantiacus]|uniref:Mechanosensitive ion channel n=1 Tax=Pistricoccus aurantiacus TaxID=1883414 RepID=A0A5B8SX28_9GAMM|nr:mechanosensitive ion channel domain-containing protein [Pistricoccus aurantiacus]QEA39348.1 mechanosensitive ion channel [Pistricoccus aurantiacus]
MSRSSLSRLPGWGVWRDLLALLLGIVLLLGAANVQAQALSSLRGLVNGEQSQDSETPPDPQELSRSLEDVISTLENAETRGALIEDLKKLRDTTAPQAQPGVGVVPRQGLLGALADTFVDLGEQAGSQQSPVTQWRERIKEAWYEAEELVLSAGYKPMARMAVEAAMMLGIWLAVLMALIAAGRLLARRYGWPLDLPREPRTGQLVVHFLRRLLPWVLAFASILALAQLMLPSAGRTLALVTAYVALCGRLLSVIMETVFSVFTRGHRFVAILHLRKRSLKRIFAIGALVALADAFNSPRLIELLGNDLTSLLSVLANVLAALLAMVFIVRFKRPIKQLIRNRPYRQRKEHTTSDYVIRVLGRFWHIPALLLVGASLVAIFVSGDDAGAALRKAILPAGFLVLALIVTGLIRRHSQQITRRKRISQYRRRLERFGYALAHIVVWIAFVELSLRVWSTSLLGFSAGARVGQALLAIGFTILLAWLVWIFADSAINRALMSSGKTGGRRVNSARAQTITPLLRNVVLVTIIIIAVIVALANLGVNVTPLLAGAGVIGLAIGFGAQTLVQDLITGLFILVEDSLAVDDFVKLGDFMGTVESLTMRTVRLRDLDGVVHIIPFSEIKSIHNMSRQFGIALMYLRIPHTMKIDDAITLMREVADDLRKDPVMRHLIWSPMESQGIQRFEEGAAVLRIRMRTSPEYQWDVMRAFNLRLKRRMEADGLDIAMPRMSVQMEGERISPDGERAVEERKAQARRAGEFGIADPNRDITASGASPDPGR